MTQLIVLNYATGNVDIIDISIEDANKCEEIGNTDWLVYEKLGYKESETNYMITNHKIKINYF